MDKNWICLRCRASEQMIATSTSIKGIGGKSGGCAWKAIELTSGDRLRFEVVRVNKSKELAREEPQPRSLKIKESAPPTNYYRV